METQDEVARRTIQLAQRVLDGTNPAWRDDPVWVDVIGSNMAVGEPVAAMDDALQAAYLAKYPIDADARAAADEYLPLIERGDPVWAARIRGWLDGIPTS